MVTEATSPPSKSPFAPGFERDTKALTMLEDYSIITRAEARKNLVRLGVELDEDPEAEVVPIERAEPRQVPRAPWTTHPKE